MTEVKKRGKPIWDRVLSRRKITETGCWEYQGWRNNKGYGMAGREGGRGAGLVLVHRVSYEHHNGQIPEGICIMHICDNPACFNPEHLKAGTHKENMADMWAKGRGRALGGEASPNARLTTKQVEEIRARYKPAEKRGRGHRSNSVELALEYGISRDYVCSLVKNKWRKDG
jgi:hypothetical protein